MATTNLKDELYKRAIDWIEGETGLGFGKVVPAQEGGEDSHAPAPGEPYIMVQISPLNVPVGEQPEGWYENDGAGGTQFAQQRAYRATLSVNAYGLEGVDHLTALEFACRKGKDYGLSVRTMGPLNDLSSLVSGGRREARHQRDFELNYTLSPTPDTTPVELATVRLENAIDGLNEVALITP